MEEPQEVTYGPGSRGPPNNVIAGEEEIYFDKARCTRATTAYIYLAGEKTNLREMVAAGFT